MIVVKAGGSKGLDMGAVCSDVAALVQRGERIILTHGGSHDTNVISEQLGHPPQFVTSVSGHVSRYTDRETLEIFVMVTGGRINKLLVEQLQQLGVNAVGLTGADGRLLEGKRKDTLRVMDNGKRKILRGDFSGVIERVNAPLLQGLLDDGYTPVIAPVAISYEGEMVNVDGDRVAAAIAAALGAETLIILSNVPGLLRAYPDESTLIRRIPAAEADRYMDQFADGRMKKKILGAVEALRDGVGQVILADGRIEHPLQTALGGAGTLIK